MQYHSIIAYLFVMVFAMTIVLTHANKEREQFADLLQKRKHLNGYWVGKRYILTSDEEPSYDSGKYFLKTNRNFFFENKNKTRSCFFFLKNTIFQLPNVLHI